MLTPAPVYLQIFDQEAGGDHSQSVVHPSGLIKLPHRCIDQGVPGFTITPGVEQFFAITPLDVRSIGLKWFMLDQIWIRNQNMFIKTKNILNCLDNLESRICCEAERAFLSEIGGGCNVPYGAYAIIKNEKIFIKAIYADKEGKKIVFDEVTTNKESANKEAKKLAKKLMSKFN